MEKIKTEEIKITGIAVRTTNKDQQAEKDIAGLWQKFMQENIAAQIPDKISNDIYCVYTEYKGDFSQPYTTLIGCRVGNQDLTPEGMKTITIESGDYIKLSAKGKLSDGIVIREWAKIWNSDLPRNYKADYEVYNETSFIADNTEIDIFVGVQ